MKEKKGGKEERKKAKRRSKQRNGEKWRERMNRIECIDTLVSLVG